MSSTTETHSRSRTGEIRKIRLVSLMAMLLRTGIHRRGQHPKQHGTVRARFEVLGDIPAEYKVGLFAKPVTYDALIRFSNGPQRTDRDRGAQGMAIKLIGVPGIKVLESQAEADTHDFILIDGPVFFVRNASSYARLVGELALLPPDKHPQKWLAWLKHAHPEDVPVVDSYHDRLADSPLAQQFWSQVPYAFGEDSGTICRYSTVPHAGNLITPIPEELRHGDYLRQAMVNQLVVEGQPASFDFCLQLHKDATPEVIDTPTEQWKTPVQRVAVITIPPQDFNRPEQDQFGEHLSYTPWHALPPHRPVGQINEIRRSVYAASQRLRHIVNLRADKEPTSPYPPKPPGRLKRLAKLAVIGAAALVPVAAIAAIAIWPRFHVALPEYPPVEKQVWLGQNWSAGSREWFHHASQGGQFPPLINVPYEWFIALEQPTLSLGAADLLADQHYLDRFGFIPSTTESGAFDWRRCREPEGTTGYDSGAAGSPSWRHRLPVGFACSDRQANPMVMPDGRPWPNPATGRTMSAVGLTCAACHTGRFTYGKTEVLIDGGPALTDIVKLNTAIGLSLFFTRYVPFRFDRFALRLLGSDDNEASRAVLREQLDDVVKRLKQLDQLDRKAAGHGVEEGFGRLDALNRIGNQVFSVDLGKPGNYAGSSAPVHYPRIWDVPWFEWAQYNGSIGQPMVRNAGEALGTGAQVIMQGTPSGALSLTAPLFTSTMQVRTLFQMEELLAGKQPDATVGFNGLVAPKWPAEVLGPIDAKLAERGARIYDDKCAHCHLSQVRSEAFWKSENWLPPNEFGRRYLRVNMIPISEIGTDPSQAEDMANRKVDVPAELGLTSDAFGEALKQVVANAVNRWYDSQTPPVPEAKRSEMDGFRKNRVQAKMEYKARPLDGIWATPPYLHNGSVPDVEALLSPVDERPTKFWLGNRAYDPARLGYRWSEEVSGGFELDTSLRGNHNTGHEFDDGPSRPGRIGRKLSPDERRALIEYLKSL
jgi:hypothetical protein